MATESVMIRIDTEHKKQVQEEAEREHRSFAQQVGYIVAKWVEMDRGPAN